MTLKHCIALALILSVPAVSADNIEPEVARLSAAIQLQTISHQDASLMDPEPFNQFLATLRDCYPRAFSEL